jgi:hypothetical protein
VRKHRSILIERLRLCFVRCIDSELTRLVLLSHEEEYLIEITVVFQKCPFLKNLIISTTSSSC